MWVAGGRAESFYSSALQQEVLFPSLPGGRDFLEDSFVRADYGQQMLGFVPILVFRVVGLSWLAGVGTCLSCSQKFSELFLLQYKMLKYTW